MRFKSYIVEFFVAVTLVGCAGEAVPPISEPTDPSPAISRDVETTDVETVDEEPAEVLEPNDLSDLQDIPAKPVTNPSAESLAQQRTDLDESLWAPEVSAQRYEAAFVRLWDELRHSKDRYEAAKRFTFDRLLLPEFGEHRALGLGIQVANSMGKSTTYSTQQWHDQLVRFESAGYRIVQSEWHHAEFMTPPSSPPKSVVSFVVDVEREEPARRVSIRGKLDVTWEAIESKNEQPIARTVTVRDVTLLHRDAEPAFREVLRATTDSQHERLMPLLLYDLDGDGLSEILLGGLNRIYWNDGGGVFHDSPIAADGLDIFDAAVLGDFDGDGRVDLVAVGTARRPLLLRGTDAGFESSPQTCSDFVFELPKSFTCGDVDGDGDLDLWIGQYKFPYLGGAMPTPFFDANDGYPAALLLNDGTGQFTDATIERGLSEKRTRRTFSSSLVDLDTDGDLDLMTVNDFAGVDMYENDGKGFFRDVTTQWVDHRHLFGMGHTFGDFNLDGRTDIYLIGMSSTTARRLDAMGLIRDDHPDINKMRSAMGYGNRMLLRQSQAANLVFRQAEHNDAVCRTGWSWGTSAFDLENDGDPDIYVVNGHNSGKSAKDYCTRYWCHDVYTGTSKDNRELRKLFRDSLSQLHRGEISWNGFEHNVLWLSNGGSEFTNVAFLLGVGDEFDSRAAASDDIDGDGRQDLLVVEYRSDRYGHAEYTLHVMKNELDEVGHWIAVRLDESLGRRESENRSPVGADVTLVTSARRRTKQIVNGDSFSTQHAPVAHFGLGDSESVESLTVAWPDGTSATIDAPKIDRAYGYVDFEVGTKN